MNIFNEAFYAIYKYTNCSTENVTIDLFYIQLLSRYNRVLCIQDQLIDYYLTPTKFCYSFREKLPRLNVYFIWMLP